MNAAIESEPKWLTTGQVGLRYEVGRDCVWDWINRGVQTPTGTLRLKATRIGGQYKVRPADLDAFIAACNGGAAPPQPTVQPHQTASHKRAMANLDRQLRRKTT